MLMFTLYIPADGKQPFASLLTERRFRYYYRITPASLARLLRHADMTTVVAHPVFGNVSVDIV